MTTAKQPYTGPSQVVTTDTKRNIYVDVYKVAKRMTLYSGTYKDGRRVQKDNLNPEKHPGLWAIASLLHDPKMDVNKNKFYVRLTFEELETADAGLAAWLREETTRYLFERHNLYDYKPKTKSAARPARWPFDSE